MSIGGVPHGPEARGGSLPTSTPPAQPRNPGVGSNAQTVMATADESFFKLDVNENRNPNAFPVAAQEPNSEPELSTAHPPKIETFNTTEIFGTRATEAIDPQSHSPSSKTDTGVSEIKLSSNNRKSSQELETLVQLKTSTAVPDAYKRPANRRISDSTFLATNNESLKNWLTQRFEVDYAGMTPNIIFDQVPFNDIYFTFNKPPRGSKHFTFASNDISRKELLRRIAQYWDLEMDFSYDDSGNPTSVNVRQAVALTAAEEAFPSPLTSITF